MWQIISMVSKCLLIKGLIQPKDVKEQDVSFTLHAAAQYYKMSKSERENICSMVNEVRDRKDKEISKLRSTYQTAIHSVLSSYLSPSQAQEAFSRVGKEVSNAIISQNDEKGCTLPLICSAKDVRTYYTEGAYSILSRIYHVTMST